VSFLRRLFGGGDEQAGANPSGPPASDAEVAEAERAHELEVLREEAARLDELRQRQLRYAQHAWKPPAQGGDRRADDEEAVSRDAG
jgi:hypothetical protein